MVRRMVNLICYVVCVLCLLAGALQGIALLWLGLDNGLVWKGLGTTAIIFAASLVLVLVNVLFANVPMPDSRSRWSADSRFEEDFAEDDESGLPRRRHREG